MEAAIPHRRVDALARKGEVLVGGRPLCQPPPPAVVVSAIVIGRVVVVVATVVGGAAIIATDIVVGWLGSLTRGKT